MTFLENDKLRFTTLTKNYLKENAKIKIKKISSCKCVE